MAEPRTEPAGTQKTTGPELRRTQTIAGGALLLTVLAAVSAPRNPEPSDFLDLGSALLPELRGPRRGAVARGDRVRRGHPPRRFRSGVQNENGIWTIPSHHDYPADGKDRLLAQTAAGIMLLEKDDFRSENVADHAAPRGGGSPRRGRGVTGGTRPAGHRARPAATAHSPTSSSGGRSRTARGPTSFGFRAKSASMSRISAWTSRRTSPTGSNAISSSWTATAWTRPSSRTTPSTNGPSGWTGATACRSGRRTASGARKTSDRTRKWIPSR